MKRFILGTYAVSFFLFLDTISSKSILGGYMTLMIFHAFFLIYMGSLELKKEHYDAKIGWGETAYLLIIVCYLLNLFRPAGEIGTGIRLISLLSIAFTYAYYIRKYRILYEFLGISYAVAAGFIIKQFWDSGCPFYIYKYIWTIMSQQRLRVVFGFYHVNAGGNLAACTLIVSFYLLKREWKGGRRKFFWLHQCIVILTDFIVLTYLLATASRTAMLSVIIWGIVYIYCKIDTSTQFKDRKFRRLLRFTTFSFIVFVAVVWLIEFVIFYFISSNRLRNFEKLLPLLNTPYKVLFGGGISSPERFAVLDAVDNAYLYLLLTVGIVGGFIILVALAIIGMRLYCLMFKNNNQLAILTFATFISHIVAGFSENCVLYYIFPSVLIYFTLYFTVCAPYGVMLHQLEEKIYEDYDRISYQPEKSGRRCKSTL